MKNKGYAILVGRFQTPELHNGHQQLIAYSVEHFEHVILFLGVHKTNATRRNPYNLETRTRMIKQLFPTVSIETIADCSTDAIWCEKLDQAIATSTQGAPVMLLGSRDSFIQSYSGCYPTQHVCTETEDSGTSMRASAATQVLDSRDFRAGIVYSIYQRYASVYPTVDLAIFNPEKTAVLLARKPDETLFRFPGGFVDPTDASLEAAALRECSEECGHIELKNLQYVCSIKVDDWRYRKEADQIMTTLFSAIVANGTPAPNDDIAELQWADLHTVTPAKLVPEHRPLLQKLMNQPL